MSDSEGNYASKDSASPGSQSNRKSPHQKKNQETNDDRPKKAVEYFRYYHLGLQLVVAVVLFTGAGIWLDRQLGTLVVFTLLGFALGFAGGLYSVIKDFPSSSSASSSRETGTKQRGESEKEGRGGSQRRDPRDH